MLQVVGALIRGAAGLLLGTCVLAFVAVLMGAPLLTYVCDPVLDALWHGAHP